MNASFKPVVIAALGSLLLHLGGYAYLQWAWTVPDVGLDFTLPMEIELGQTDAVALQQASPSIPPQSSHTQPSQAQPPAVPPPSPGMAASGPGTTLAPDAGVPPSNQGPSNASSSTRPRRPPVPRLLPRGAQIALRLDMRRIRRSPLAGQVASLLQAIPDWQAVLAGSGVEPLEDLDRVLITTPNLQRAQVVIAGRVRGEATKIREAVAQMARHRGQSVQWRQAQGVPVADWHNEDPTARVLAIVGPQHFVICRPQDLPRVLAIAQSRTTDGESDPPGSGAHGQTDQAEPANTSAPPLPADALLSMRWREVLSLEVEGAREFTRARAGGRVSMEVVPERLRLGVSQRRGGLFHAHLRGRYANPAQATQARGHWDQMRAQFAENPAVAFMGFSEPLQTGQLTTRRRWMTARLDLSRDAVQILLNLVQSALRDHARRQAGPPPAGETVPSPDASVPVFLPPQPSH